MDEWTIEALGLVGGCLTTLAWVPQLVRTWRTRSARDISLPMLLMLLVGIQFWLTYGLLVGSVAIVASNVVTLVLNLGILSVKLREERRPRILPAE